MVMLTEVALPIGLFAGLPGALGADGGGDDDAPGIAVVMGLNDFVWSFLAAYPAFLDVRRPGIHLGSFGQHEWRPSAPTLGWPRVADQITAPSPPRTAISRPSDSTGIAMHAGRSNGLGCVRPEA